MKKILVLSLIICSLLFVAVDPATAADRTITDEKGDVIGYNALEEDITTSEFIDVANIDIIEMTYTKTGKSVTLTLKVDGEIEDRGNMDDLEHLMVGDREIDLAYYTLLLATSETEYMIVYINQNCNISYGTSEESQALDTFTINNDDTLSVTFDLQSDQETYEYMESTILYTKFPDFSEFGDIEDPDFDWSQIDLSAFDFEEFVDEAIDEGTDNGDDVTNGDNNDNDGQSGSLGGLDSGLLMFVAIIGIIVIVGVAIVIFIIRR